jgi:hypothetical protein
LHVTPQVDFKAVNNTYQLSLTSLSHLNKFGEKAVFLTSNDDVTASPTWLKGQAPDSSADTHGAKSCAVIVNDKGSGNVDAFYFYFYSYNQGGNANQVLEPLSEPLRKKFGNVSFGDHVGDWYV